MRDQDIRDMRGYGRTPPDPKWPGGARVAVSFVINFEEGAEMSLSAGDAFTEPLYEVTDEISGVADRCMVSLSAAARVNERAAAVTDESSGVADRCTESHFEYGAKACRCRIAASLACL